MINRVIYLLIVIVSIADARTTGIKNEQLQYPRVREAYDHYGDEIQTKFARAGVAFPPKQLLYRVFKLDGELELWASSGGVEDYQLVHVYSITWPWMPGRIGPKSQKGDRQVPEGIYEISRLNPVSRFHLSLGLNYPNKADRNRSRAAELGGDIFIHGSFVSIGCIPVGDEAIKELYVATVETMDAGVGLIQVQIFPCRMDDLQCIKELEDFSPKDESVLQLWNELNSEFRKLSPLNASLPK